MSPDDTDLEQRLARYGTALDRAAEDAADHHPSPSAVVAPARRVRRVLAGAAAVSVVVIGGLVVFDDNGSDVVRADRGDEPRPAEFVPPSAPGEFRRYLIDGWRIGYAHESEGPMSKDSRSQEPGRFQLYRDPAGPADGPAITVMTPTPSLKWDDVKEEDLTTPAPGEPAPAGTTEIQGMSEGRAFRGRSSPLMVNGSWTIDRRRPPTYVHGIRIDDETLDRFMRGLRRRDGLGWDATWLPDGFTVEVDQSAQAAERYHSGEWTFERDGHKIGLYQVAGDLTTFRGYLDDRLAEADEYRMELAVGHEVSYVRYGDGRNLTAMWFADGAFHELRNDDGAEDVFFEALRSLREVDQETWEDAQP